MAELTVEQIRSIQDWGWYADPSDVDPNLVRFVSGDRRFPISVTIPAWLATYFRRDDAAELSLELGSDSILMFVNRTDLALLALRGDRLAKQVIAGEMTLLDYQRACMQAKVSKPDRDSPLWNVAIKRFELDRRAVGLGENHSGRHRIVGARLGFERQSGGTGEWVFFSNSGDPNDLTRGRYAANPILWTIGRNPDPDLVDSFPTVLASFRWR